MLTINGKVLLTTDWHFGVNQNRPSKLKTMSMVAMKICDYIKKNKVESVIFGGDMFHQRNMLSIETINVAIHVVESIAKLCRVYLILGNHDLYNKTSNTINSMKIFKHINRVTIIDSATECSINGNRTLLIPWNSDLSSYQKNEFDMMIGHFDISERYLIASYVENNIKKNHIDAGDLEKLKHEDILRDSGLDDLDFDIENEIDTIINSKNASDLIGDWIEIVKERGVIFSGHIHSRKEFYTKNRKFIFIGSPYQQTLGEIDSEDGFYVLGDRNELSFHRLEGIPVHIDLKMSEISSDVDSFDFSIVNGNIIHRIYDVELDNEMQTKINSRIMNNNPFEELPPEYSCSTRYVTQDGIECVESISSIRKSKLEYIQNYINNMDDEIFKTADVTKEELFEEMRTCYDMVNERM